MKRTFGVVVAVLTLSAPLGTNAQTGSTAERQAAAEAALVNGQPEAALQLTDELLAAEPTRFDALFVKALALIDLDNPAEAAVIAGRAYRAAEGRVERLQAANLAARARFEAGHFARAEWWLRRASNDVETLEEERQVIGAFQAVRRANPLTFQLGFGAAPTNNFNNGAEDGSIFFEGLGTFELPPDQLPLSGIEYNGDMLLEYRVAGSAEQQTHVGLYAYARTYDPSSSARASVPGIDGFDYSLGIVDLFLRHDRLVFPELGVTQISFHNGRLFYGGEHYWDYVRVALSQDVQFSGRGTLNFQIAQENQFGVPDRQADTDITTISVRYRRARQNNDRIGIRLSKKIYDTEAFENSYEDYKLSVDYQFARPFMGIAFGGSLGIGHTNYDRFFLSLDGRRDDYLFGTAFAVWQEVSVYGFSPRADLTFERRGSDVSQYARNTAALRLGLSSTF
ncbi:MAG: hypothetical protein AAF718_10540 [Pseudomonadota bacterium]